MKKIFMLSLLGLLSLPTFAETNIIKCMFTEPFYTLVINLDKKEVAHLDVDYDDVDPLSTTIQTALYSNITVKATTIDPFLPTYEISDKDGLLMTLTLTNEASDGMSDLKFPFEAHYFSRLYPENYEHDYWGGCETNVLKSWRLK